MNNAKINEQWRGILRKLKRRELHENAVEMWNNFDRAVEAKDAVIGKLYEQLQGGDSDHKRLQEAHLDQLDQLIGNYFLSYIVTNNFQFNFYIQKF